MTALTPTERKQRSRDRRRMRTLELPPEAFEAIEEMRRKDDAGLAATVTRLMVDLYNSPAISKDDLLSSEAVEAYRIAAHRLGHRPKYRSWPPDKRITYLLSETFDAVLEKARKERR